MVCYFKKIKNHSFKFLHQLCYFKEKWQLRCSNSYVFPFWCSHKTAVATPLLINPNCSCKSGCSSRISLWLLSPSIPLLRVEESKKKKLTFFLSHALCKRQSQIGVFISRGTQEAIQENTDGEDTNKQAQPKLHPPW